MDNENCSLDRQYQLRCQLSRARKDQMDKKILIDLTSAPDVLLESPGKTG
jgi:hypothetical protein